MNNMKQKKTFLILALLLMTAVGATAQTTYTVTVKEGTEDAANWSATPNPAGEGQTVTIKYNGTKKVKSVTAAKKAAAHPQAEGHALTASALGEIVGSDGKAYAVADKDNLPTFVTAVAVIAYVGSETGHPTYKHGLAIALTDEGKMNWSDANSACGRKAAFSGAAWLLPNQNQWKAMFKAFGDEEKYTGLQTALVTAGGSKFQADDEYYYWYAEPDRPKDIEGNGLYMSPNSGYVYWRVGIVDDDYHVRACLVF